jgi:hypothetical protein
LKPLLTLKEIFSFWEFNVDLFQKEKGKKIRFDGTTRALCLTLHHDELTDCFYFLFQVISQHDAIQAAQEFVEQWRASVRFKVDGTDPAAMHVGLGKRICGSLSQQFKLRPGKLRETSIGLLQNERQGSKQECEEADENILPRNEPQRRKI